MSVFPPDSSTDINLKSVLLDDKSLFCIIYNLIIAD